ncbi:DapH/DapD/GlmU-related protein [Polynucleobacter sp. UK-Gri1-W3]|uniref:acyltransferase n=1 Tax=Polynucleobacter sp. UK-Gri1-W3 TaxID=1819737 RepID=UPI001C0A9BCF|nr:acyltransferase [Polynucleobacter sp. UK-Gri1-W3]MBU3538248.1 acyltransferase [Polynucleobacter sp. UK-Gri1-W3]
MKKLGVRSLIYKPMLITGASNISIGARTMIRDFSRIEVINRPNVGWSPDLFIGDNVNIEQNVHIICQCSVKIGSNVSITGFSVIVDTYHPIDHPEKLPKIGSRLPTKRTFVEIGDGTFIGMHSIIEPNVKIGKGCVIAAGSIVRSDIPDYSMAAGMPAKIVAQYNFTSNGWIYFSKNNND